MNNQNTTDITAECHSPRMHKVEQLLTSMNIQYQVGGRETLNRPLQDDAEQRVSTWNSLHGTVRTFSTTRMARPKINRRRTSTARARHAFALDN